MFKGIYNFFQEQQKQKLKFFYLLFLYQLILRSFSKIYLLLSWTNQRLSFVQLQTNKISYKHHFINLMCSLLLTYSYNTQKME